MATMFVRHSVKAFGTWKTAYDEFDAERKTMGVTGHGVFQAEGNPNDVTVYHEFESMDAAKSFAGTKGMMLYGSLTAPTLRRPRPSRPPTWLGGTAGSGRCRTRC